jgi:endonuclease G
MAKLRRNHTHQAGIAVIIVRVVVFASVLILLAVSFKRMQSTDPTLLPGDVDDDRPFYYPEVSEGCALLEHTHFALCYSERYEQARWVAYVLNRERVQGARTRWGRRFVKDANVRSGSADWSDYERSGYVAAPLAATADMAFDGIADRETYLMSNISPQKKAFHTGIWHTLEEQSREWAVAYKKLYVVTGPVLQGVDKTIGKNKVGVPKAFFKILLDLSDPAHKGIAFILPNRASNAPLERYAISIDSAEQRLGIDFFPHLMTEETEHRIEAECDIHAWNFPQKH